MAAAGSGGARPRFRPVRITSHQGPLKKALLARAFFGRRKRSSNLKICGRPDLVRPPFKDETGYRVPFARSIALRQFAGWQLLGLAAVCALATVAVVGAAPRSATTASMLPPTLPFTTDNAFAPLPGAAVGPSSQGERARVASRYGGLPLAFEPNRGQFDKRARW